MRTGGCPVTGLAAAPASPRRAAAASAAATCRAGAAAGGVAAGLGQGGGDQGAGQPGQQHRGAGVEADVGDPDLHGRVARGQPGQEVDAPLVQRRAAPDEAADRRVVGGRVRPRRGRHRGRPA